MAVQFLENPREMDFARIADLLAGFGPVRGKPDAARTEAAFLHSTGVFAAKDQENYVAAGRVLSDRHAWTLITDVAFLPEYSGIGGELLDNIKARYRGHELFTWTDPQKIPFFEEHGFKRSKNSFTYAGPDEEALDPSLPLQSFYLPVGYRFESEFYPHPGRFPQGRKNPDRKAGFQPVFSRDCDGLDFTRLNELLTLAFGGHERDASVTRETFRNSPYVEFAYDSGKLVGCGRAESDGISQGFILNVAVNPDWQGLGLGWEVVRRLADQMKGQNIFLNTHPGGVGFYNRRGFRRNKTALLFPAHPDMPPDAAKGFVLPSGFRFPDEFETVQRKSV